MTEAAYTTCMSFTAIRVPKEAGDRQGALAQHRNMVIVVPLTTAERDWPTRVVITEKSFAICEQPRSISLERVTGHEAAGHEIAEVRRISSFLIGGELW